MYVVDPVSRLRVLRPNLDTGRVRTDSLGFRNPEIPQPKPPGTVRLAFVGASTTFCAEASSDQAIWPAIVARRLQEAHPEVKIDYVNAGIPGFVVETSRTNFVSRVARLQPDIVIIYHATNDLSGDTRRIAAERGFNDEAPERASWLARRSVLVNLVEKNVAAWTRRDQVIRGENQLEFDPEPLAADFEDRMVGLIRAAQESSMIVAVATFSTRVRRVLTPEEQKSALITAAYYMPYMSVEGLIEGYAAYNRAIGRAARRTGALLVAGENSIPADADHFVDSVHFSDKGSARMADRLIGAMIVHDAMTALIRGRAAKNR
jgi:lysophospholipase L1-like esterase